MTNRSNNAGSGWRGSWLRALTGARGEVGGGPAPAPPGLAGAPGVQRAGGAAGQCGQSRGGAAGRSASRSGATGGADKRPHTAERRTPPPMQRDPLKARDSPLPNAVKGALASAAPFRSSLKKHSFGGFFLGGAFCFIFSLAFYGFIFAVAPAALHRSSLGGGLATRPPLHCRAATRVRGPVLPDRSHSHFTTQLFTELNSFFPKAGQVGSCNGLQHRKRPSVTSSPIRLCHHSLRGGAHPLLWPPVRLQ